MKIIGILNANSDSFFEASRTPDPIEAGDRVVKMIEDGADYVDVGAVSTRPGAEKVSAEEELHRLHPVLTQISTKIGFKGIYARLIVDAMHPEAVIAALNYGVRFFNLYGGIYNHEQAVMLREQLCHVIVYPSHEEKWALPPMKGRLAFFRQQIEHASGVFMQKTHLILDPGIGFGLDAEGSVELAMNFWRFRSFGHPLAIGVSRKRHLGTLVATSAELPPPEARLEAGLAETLMVVNQGAEYVRTHDVLPTWRFFTAWERLRQSKKRRPT